MNFAFDSNSLLGNPSVSRNDTPASPTSSDGEYPQPLERPRPNTLEGQGRGSSAQRGVIDPPLSPPGRGLSAQRGIIDPQLSLPERGSSAQRGIVDPQLIPPWGMPCPQGQGSTDGHQPFPASQWNLPPWMMAWNPLMAMQQNMLPRPTQANQTPASKENPSPTLVGAKRDNPSKGKGPSKKARFYEPGAIATGDEDSENEDLAEPFDPTAYYSRAAQPLPEAIDAYVVSHFQKCLPTPARKAMAREDPAPDCQAFKCVEPDEISWAMTLPTRLILS